MSKKKRRLCGDLQTLRAEVQEAEAVKKCVEQAILIVTGLAGLVVTEKNCAEKNKIIDIPESGMVRPRY